MRRHYAPNLSLRLVGPADAKVHLYRWSPGPALRAGGFKGLDLWADGPALTLSDWRAAGFAAPASDELKAKGPRARPMGPTPAARVAEALTEAARARLAAERAGATGAANPARRRALPARFTLARLLDDFLAAKAKTLPAKTIVNYRSHLVPVRAIAGDELAAALTKDLILDMHEALEPRGAHAAYKAIQTLRTALIWAHGRGEWRGGAMPAREDYTMLGLSKPAPRLRVGTPEEMDALRLAFDDPHAIYAMTQAPAHARTLSPRLSGGDALIMLLWTAARVGDGLAMHEGHLRSESGADWLAYRQAKTGALVQVPVMGALKERLPDMLARRRIVARAHALALAAQTPLILSEEDGRGYRRDRPDSGLGDHRPFNDLWAERRALAATIAPSLAGEGQDPLGAPWLAFNAADCRDTACTRLLDAGASLAEIAAWHGSSVENIVRLARHYIAIAPRHAAAAGDKLAAMATREGIRV